MDTNIYYRGDLPKACDNCYLIRKIERYVGKVRTICPISGYSRTKGKRSINCPFVCIGEEKK